MEELNRIKSALSRRTFMASAGTAAAAALVTGCSDDGTVTTPTSSGVSDNDILNFALNLEYLEAEFYLRAATGSGLSSTDAGGSSAGTVTGGAKISGLTSFQQSILDEIAYDEQQHVQFLRKALGSAAVVRPAIDLTNSFNALASAAGIASSFNPFTNFDTFLVGAFIFEDVGVTAYNGAAPLISNAGITSGILSAAAGIAAVEAYHAGYVRTALTANALLQGVASYPYLGYANKVATLRATLGGGAETQLTVPSGTSTPLSIVSASSIAASDSNAIGYSRSTDQVLHIVYGSLGGTTSSAGVKSGAFFPNGLNGNIAVTKS